jgi:hypothetical protein
VLAPFDLLEMQVGDPEYATIMNARIASYRSMSLGKRLYLSTSNTKIYYVAASFTQYEKMPHIAKYRRIGSPTSRFTGRRSSSFPEAI